MECPRCNNEVNEHDKVCPHCKKVLLLECPICHKLSRTPLCSECGFLIVSKCHNCGQINQTIKGTCKKCGFSTYKSISMNEAETEEFACLAITFPNLEDLRPALKNKQIFNKFYKKLKSFIFAYGKQQDNRVQIIDKTFIIKYYKEFSLSSSVNKAVSSAIDLMNKVAEISYKFKKSKGIKMACKMTILKRNLENDNDSFNTGLNIKLINTDIKKEDYADGLQLITDQYINNIVSRQYKLEMIYSSQVNDELLEFYEFPIKEQLTPIVEDDKEEKTNIITKPKELPKLVDYSEDSSSIDLYSNKVINIQTKCEFLTVPGNDVAVKIKEFLKNDVFITLKSTPKLGLMSSDIISAISQVKTNILHVVCTQGFVYEPYACFKELISSYLGFDSKLANLDSVMKSKIASFDKNEFLYKLLVHDFLDEVEPQEALKTYIEIFYSFIETQHGATIFIENFDLIDETSLEILISLIENFEKIGVSIIVTVPNKYLVHKEINELLYLDAYKEITICKTEYENIIATISDDLSEVTESFYFNKIKEQFFGSLLYFQHAFQYLKDVNIIFSHEGKLLINSEKTIIFPSSLEQLITKRFESLDENEAFILAYSAFLGDKIVIDILKDLQIENLDDAIQSLLDKKLITYQNSIIQVQNYRILKSCIKEFLTDEVKEIITKNILEKLHTKTIDVIKSLGLITESQMTIYELSLYAINHGDFNAYLRNCKRFLNIIETIPKKNLLPELKDAQNNIYSTLSLYLNKYPSHKIYAISKVIFDDCLRKKDDLKIINISSLMLDSALMGENYVLAHQSLHQVLIRMLNPIFANAIENENIKTKYFFYSCINVKILFHSGKFKRCIEVLDTIINSIDEDLLAQLSQSNVSKDAFVGYFMGILLYGALARIIVFDNTLISFFEKINYMFSQDVPAKNMLILLEKLFHHEDFDFDESLIESDASSQIVGYLIYAFKNFNGEYNIFAQNVYKVKLLAREMKESFWSLLCDLLIGYSYQKLEARIKAKVIFNDVASISQRSGMGFIYGLSTLFVANLTNDLHEYDSVLKLLSENVIIISKSNTDDKLLSVLSYILQINALVAQNSVDIDIRPILYKLNYSCKRYNMEYLLSLLIDTEEYIELYKNNFEKNTSVENTENSDDVNNSENEELKSTDDNQSETIENQPVEDNPTE